MRLQFSALLLGALALAGCSDESAPAVKMPEVSEVFPQIILPPGAEFVSKAGSEDALQLTFRTPATPEQVSAYYRAALTRQPWELLGDTPGANGAATLYAERSRVPIWIRIQPDSAGSGALVEMNGALLSRRGAAKADSAAAAAAESAGTDSTVARPAAAGRARPDSVTGPVTP